MSLQPTNRAVDRTSTAPFLLRLFWRQNRELLASDFSVAPPEDTSNVADYSNLLPPNIRQQSVQIYTWPTCSLAELTGLLTSVLPEGVLPNPAVGTRLVYKLVFPDTRAEVREGGRGKWIDKPLGSVVIGGREADMDAQNGEDIKHDLEGDAERTLGDARFVIGDYVVCTLYPPDADGRIAPVPPPRAAPRPDYSSRGPPPPRENGYGGGGGYGRGGGGYRGGYGGGGRGGGFGEPPGEWRRGDRPPPSYGGYGRGRGRPY